MENLQFHTAKPAPLSAAIHGSVVLAIVGAMYRHGFDVTVTDAPVTSSDKYIALSLRSTGALLMRYEIDFELNEAGERLWSGHREGAVDAFHFAGVVCALSVQLCEELATFLATPVDSPNDAASPEAAVAATADDEAAIASGTTASDTAAS